MVQLASVYLQPGPGQSHMSPDTLSRGPGRGHQLPFDMAEGVGVGSGMAPCHALFWGSDPHGCALAEAVLWLPGPVSIHQEVQVWGQVVTVRAPDQRTPCPGCEWWPRDSPPVPTCPRGGGQGRLSTSTTLASAAWVVSCACPQGSHPRRSGEVGRVDQLSSHKWYAYAWLV